MSDGITVTIEEESLQRTLKRLAYIFPKIQKKVQGEVRRSALAIQSDARMRVPVASNRLRSSIRTQFRGDRLGARIGSKLQYAEYVEKGRRPGRMPPSSALEAWVRTKVSVENIKSIAFLIARKIGREGTKPQPYLLPAARKEKPRYFRAIRMILKKI